MYLESLFNSYIYELEVLQKGISRACAVHFGAENRLEGKKRDNEKSEIRWTYVAVYEASSAVTKYDLYTQ